MKEPERKSFLDILKRNYSLADRLALTTRFVYVGEYRGSQNDLQKIIRQSVKDLNEEYGQVVLTGFLLLYTKCFLHLIEASEETIYRHLRAILRKTSDKILGRIIPLPAYHNVYKTYFSDWHFVFVKNPPLLLDQIEKTDLDIIQRQVKNCLFKMYLLSEYLMDTGSRHYEKTKETLKNLTQIVPHYLPEVTIVSYLLSVKSPVLPDIRDHLKNFNRIPYINFYNDYIWPAPCGLVPRALHQIYEKQRRP